MNLTISIDDHNSPIDQSSSPNVATPVELNSTNYFTWNSALGKMYNITFRDGHTIIIGPYNTFTDLELYEDNDKYQIRISNMFDRTQQLILYENKSFKTLLNGKKWVDSPEFVPSK